jgi:formylglycine-generating enzyme
MIWIPKGLLIAGTPPGKVPRIADEEMAGEQIAMGGFYIDQFAHPNEPGAIATTSLTAEDARAICTEQGKRLCTELELERACKGPENTAYPYGDGYRDGACGTKDVRALVPNGFHATCTSAFGVQDLVGNVWVWTDSDWKRGGAEGLATVRGGGGGDGDVVSRCAMGRGVRREVRAPDIGVRCCAGDTNTFQVVVRVERGETLRFRIGDDEMNASIATAVKKVGPLKEGSIVAAEELMDAPAFSVERSWTWHPLGNEELILGGGCAASPVRSRCGVFVVRVTPLGIVPVSFVSTERWQPTLGETDTSKDLFVYGGDEAGAFRKRLAYSAGRLRIGEPERKKKRGRKYYFP